MKRGTVFIILFLLIAAGIVAASTFLRSQPPVTIRLAVHPLVSEWVRAAAARYNATNPTVSGTQRIVIAVETIDDLAVWNANAPWDASDHPDGWIPANAISVDYAAEARMNFTTLETTVAQSVLLWGGFTSEVEAITENGTRVFDWDALQLNIDTVNPALPHPTRTMQGLAIILSAAADFSEIEFLQAAELGDPFRAWVLPILEAVPNFNTLGSSPAQTMAARGPSAGSVALLPETDWLNNLSGQLVNTSDPVRLNYPRFNVIFDFPLTRWNGATVDDSPQAVNADAITAGLRAFGDYLKDDGERAFAEDDGLRTGIIRVPTSAAFTQGVRYGAQNTPDLARPVQFPTRNELRTFTAWLEGVIGR